MLKKVIFFIFCLFVIYQILIFKEVPKSYKDYKTVRKINKKLNEIVTPSELLKYYKQLKDLAEEDVLFKHKKSIIVKGIFNIMEGDSGFFSENKRIIFDLNVFLDKLSLSDKQKMEKNDGKKVILIGKVGGRIKGDSLLNLYVEKLELVSNKN